jgi:hypothetical protein
VRVIFRKRCITSANSGPDRSLSALSKKNFTVIKSPVKSPVLKTAIPSKTWVVVMALPPQSFA